MHPNTTTERRDCDFGRDGALDGVYVETRRVTIASGPSAGETKAVLDFHVGLDDELVTVWPSAVLRRMLRDELRLRGKSDFEPGERVKITRKPEKRAGPNGRYWDFEHPRFEHAAPKPTAAELLADPGEEELPSGGDHYSQDEGDLPL
jgi:hypothetical protein